MSQRKFEEFHELQNQCLGLTKEQIELKFLDNYSLESNCLSFKDAFYKCIFQDDLCIGIEYIAKSISIMDLCAYLQDKIEELREENKKLRLKLPSFNIGDKVYILIDKEARTVTSGIIESITIDKDQVIYWYSTNKNSSQWKFTEASIGKTVFHDHAEIVFTNLNKGE